MIQIILLDNGVRVANIDYPNNHLVFGIERTNIIEIFDSGKKVVSAPYTEFINELGELFLTPQSVITTLELSYLNLVSQEELDVEIADRIAADTVLSNRTTILENNEYKILYFETISASTGTITKPTNSTIILDQFYSGGDAIVETLVNGQPSGQSPLTSGGSVVSVSSFSVNGNYTLSSTPSSFDVALLYILKIKAIDYGNIIKANELNREEEGVVAGIIAKTFDDQNYISVNNNQVLIQSSDGVAPTIIDLQPGIINIQGANVQKNGSEIAIATDVNLKSNTASPTFTGTVTTPSIIVSSETASRVAIIDASKNVKSADTATYPSLAELAYIKGLTSAIQTQLDGKRYTIPFNSINFNPADATTYYFGGFFSVAPVTTAAVRQITVPKTGTITEVSFNSAATVVGTAGNMTISIRVNNTTDYLVTNAFDISSAAYLTVSGLSIPISANDLIEFKLLTPTWATNPTVLYFTGNILVK